PRALLSPRLLAPAADLGPRFRGGGATAGRRHPGHHHLVHEGHVHRRLEQLGGEFACPRLLAVLVDERDRRPRPQAPVFAAGFFTLDLTITKPPGGPGIAPRMSSRLRSGSVCTTWRLMTVTRSFPICPAIRVPLNTRDGVEAPPMEPGERCLRSVPCEPGSP